MKKENKNPLRKALFTTDVLKKCIDEDNNAYPVVLSFTDLKGGAVYVLKNDSELAENLRSARMKNAGVIHISRHNGKTYVDTRAKARYIIPDNMFKGFYEEAENILTEADADALYRLSVS